MVAKIVSGGQTGVDRAALDAGLANGFDCGGWCPRGRRAEDGTIPDHYPLRETPSGRYIERTRFNIRDSDATLVLTNGRASGGTAATIGLARRAGRPCLVLDMTDTDAQRAVADIREWLAAEQIHALNVAGPRDAGDGIIYATAHDILHALFTALARDE